MGANGWIVHTTRYDCTAITVCGLIAVSTNIATTASIGDPQEYAFSDGPVRTVGADLSAGKWGYQTGAVFAGTVSINTALVYRSGIQAAYAAVGTSSNAVTISIAGGSSITTSGVFDVSLVAATNGSSTATMTTTGWANIGFVQCASQQWFSAMDGVGDTLGFVDSSSVTTNAGFLSYTWTCTPATNYVVMRWDKYGQILWQTNVWALSSHGYISAGSQMRIVAQRFWSPPSQQWRMFGWRAIYGPLPSETWFTGSEIDARAEYTSRGYGQ